MNLKLEVIGFTELQSTQRSLAVFSLTDSASLSRLKNRTVRSEQSPAIREELALLARRFQHWCKTLAHRKPALQSR